MLLRIRRKHVQALVPAWTLGGNLDCVEQCFVLIHLCLIYFTLRLPPWQAKIGLSYPRTTCEYRFDMHIAHCASCNRFAEQKEKSSIGQFSKKWCKYLYLALVQVSCVSNPHTGLNRFGEKRFQTSPSSKKISN